MSAVLQAVTDRLQHGPSVVTVRLSRLKPGKKNEDILRVKRRLKKRGFYEDDQKLGKNFDKAFQNVYAKYQRSLGYSGNDANGIPGKSSLQKLGFRVVS